ncbi:MAG: major facilitator superfamily 1 [Bryobacterales bacterium]|nr:major facilitator superfamily 1 [Bryobacterales bacterium]
MASSARELTDIQNQKPTRVRYWVVVFAVTLAIITYIDRVALSQAAPSITKELGLSKTQMGMAFSAFILFYALFEIPSGVLGDRYGPRKVLMRIVVWWSFFIAASGRAWSFASLVVIETLFGAGEAGCFPNIAKAFSVWLPQDERVRAQGIVWLSARWGGAITPVLVYWIFQFVSWRNAFALFGLMGVVWAFFFYRWFRDRPSDNPKVNAAELTLLRSAEHNAEVHGGIPWGKFLASPQVWLLCAQYFCLSYSWYFYATWLPTYLREGRHLNPSTKEFAILAGMPLFLGGIGSLFTGFISKPLTRLTGSVTKTRKFLACTGFVGASALLVTSTLLHDPIAAVMAMAFASFCNDLAMPGSWGACMDVGGRYAGTLSGTMNMAGNGGGALASTLAGVMLTATNNNWNLVIYVAAAVYFLGAFFWLALDPVTPLERA